MFYSYVLTIGIYLLNKIEHIYEDEKYANSLVIHSRNLENPFFTKFRKFRKLVFSL